MSQLPSLTLRRAHIPQISKCTQQQTRHASLLRRPLRPYTFTQLITLSDGSTYTQRTTSPAPVFRSTKDTRNHPTWQPSLDSLRNVEQDEAGRLRAFRERFGRGWDAEEVVEEGAEASEEESLMDLISGGNWDAGAAAAKEGKGKK
ncbi:hypothetical protein BP6252_07746 [Coleophoma cylindrospora]|uniref:Ribosomal protein bL31m N-terminal domain-containing protein n=1 Tax=Coleophoma cylindrospora TaxID=1849047 RepID=A0A3D8RAW3_9HELO|nr:hypothetical protein BP6252_07746 [Coleophoma cylindrospora]